MSLSRFLGFPRHDGGNAAIEFALLAPLLVFACLAVVDLGFAINQRMAADHVLRVGAEAAMSDPGEATVQQVLQQTAGANFPTVSADPMPTSISTSSDTLYLRARRFCSCPESRSTEVACTATCAAGKTPLAFYRLTAAKRYSGMLLPSTQINSALQVEAR